LQATHWLAPERGDIVWCTAASGWSKSARNVFIAPWLRGAGTTGEQVVLGKGQDAGELRSRGRRDHKTCAATGHAAPRLVLPRGANQGPPTASCSPSPWGVKIAVPPARAPARAAASGPSRS
jgi:hypothetical protein